MKANLRGRIREFLTSEEGKVSAKAPLSLGITGGSFLLAQVILTSSVSADDDCGADCQTCVTFCEGSNCTSACMD